MKKILFIFIFIFLKLNISFAENRGLDSICKVKINPFWDYLLSHKQLETNVFTSAPNNYIPTEGSIYAKNGQVILKKGKLLFIQISQTGIIFQFQNQEDSFLTFKRLDKTININYNIDANHFIYQNELYNYGGYGFWKSNGALRKFNKVDQEWDIVALNKEVFSTTYNWYSSAEGRMYVPYEREMNAGVMGQEKGVKKFDAFYLDMAKREWVGLGELSKELRSITQDDFLNGTAFKTKEGYLYLDNDQAWYFDFLHNQVFKSNQPDLNQFLTRRRSNILLFEDGGNLYSYNAQDKVLQAFAFDKRNFELMPFPIWTKKNTVLWYSLGLLLLAFIGFGVGWWVRRRMHHKIRASQLKMLKTKSIHQAFVGVELTLIELLLQAASKKQIVEIHQINHVLGIKDKNLGLQKKVRSDVMNAINDKYQFITQADIPLIGSKRKEEDKRFFEYYISPTEIGRIQKLMQEK